MVDRTSDDGGRGGRGRDKQNPAKKRRGLKVGDLNEEPFSGLNPNG